MTVQQRLKEFIKSENISINKFEKICGLSTGYVGNMRVSIQPGKIENIALNFPNLNTGWLMTGDGEMLKFTETNIDKNEIYSKEIEQLQIRLTEKDEMISLLKEKILRLETDLAEFKKGSMTVLTAPTTNAG